MSFKIKNRKKKTTDKRITIDAKHNNKIKIFKDQKRSLSPKNRELNKLKTELKVLLKKGLKEFTDDEFEKNNLKINDNLENEINTIKENKEEIDYYLNTSNLLFDYYSNSSVTSVKKVQNPKDKSKTVMDWLNNSEKKVIMKGKMFVINIYL